MLASREIAIPLIERGFIHLRRMTKSAHELPEVLSARTVFVKTVKTIHVAAIVQEIT